MEALNFQLVKFAWQRRMESVVLHRLSPIRRSYCNICVEPALFQTCSSSPSVRPLPTAVSHHQLHPDQHCPFQRLLPSLSRLSSDPLARLSDSLTYLFTARPRQATPRSPPSRALLALPSANLDTILLFTAANVTWNALAPPIRDLWRQVRGSVRVRGCMQRVIDSDHEKAVETPGIGMAQCKTEGKACESLWAL